MVLVEAMAAGLPVVAAASGAIPEVLRGAGADVRARRLARARAAAGRGAARRARPASAWTTTAASCDMYSGRAYAERLAGAYERVLA